jgi:hypothetical protein
VEYATKPIEPVESRLFNFDETFAPAVNTILQECAPYDLVAGVQQYRYFRNLARTIQVTMENHQQRFHTALERTMEVMSDLENADAFNRLKNFVEAGKHTKDIDIPAFKALDKYLAILASTHPEERPLSGYVQPRPRITITRPSFPCRLQRPANAPPPSPIIRATRTSDECTTSKRCYKCHGYGHTRAQCPSSRTPWHLRK